MASSDQINNNIAAVDNDVKQLHTDIGDLKTSIDAVNSTLQSGFSQLNNTLQAGFSQLVSLGSYTNQALYQISQQNDTIICILEHISKQTCELVNEGATQIRLQEAIEDSANVLSDLYAATHAEAALERERERKLKHQIEECCPPPKPEPPCKYEPCREPKKLNPPPEVQPPKPPRPGQKG
jgi:uncharacterized protein (DUF3084 family)